MEIKVNNGARLEQTRKCAEDLKRCIDCGNCTLWCPIYEEDRMEESVARGKHKMIRAMLAGEASYNEEFATLLSKCTLCKACTVHCPFEAQVQSTIIASRADKVKTEGISFPNKVVYQWLIPHRWLFGNAVRVASWLQWILSPKRKMPGSGICPSSYRGSGKGEGFRRLPPNSCVSRSRL